MKFINLTMPLYDDMPAGHGHTAFKEHPLWPQAFRKDTVGSTMSGSEFHVYNIFCEPGTRFILPSYRPQYRDDPTRLHNVALERIILRDTVIVDLPLKEYEIVEPAQLEEAFNKAPVQRGDAILIRSGWGDNERYLKMGHDYREKGPHFKADSADKLMELLEKNGSDLWLYDLCDMTGRDRKTGENLRGFTIRAGMIAIGGAVNCGAITKPRVKLVIQPLQAKDCHMAPCSVAAIEE